MFQHGEVSKYLDSTNLNLKASRSDINTLIRNAIDYKFKGICITPAWTSYVKNKLKGTDVKLITVPNWYVGGGIEQSVCSMDSCWDLCDEIDFIVYLYEYNNFNSIKNIVIEIERIRKKTKGTLKIIIETMYLRTLNKKIYKKPIEEVLKHVCDVLKDTGIDYLKTDSGLFPRVEFDTLLEDCKILKENSKFKIKAAGGIRTYTQTKQLIDIGVDRIGTSSAELIVNSDI